MTFWLSINTSDRTQSTDSFTRKQWIKMNVLKKNIELITQLIVVIFPLFNINRNKI
jgi:hypothetical protein